MKEERTLFTPLVALIILLAVGLGVFIVPEDKQEAIPASYKPTIHLTITVPKPNMEYLQECKDNKVQAKSIMDSNKAFMETVDSLEFQTCDMVVESLGTYYITGYTSLECGGSVMTASGATVHKSSYVNRLIEPTTCAIDPSLHDFGDLFYIPAFDTVYIAEDTGSAVKGKHLDLYFFDEEYNYALSITGYYEVYSVEYVYGTVPASYYDIRGLVASESLGDFFTDGVE